MKRLPNELSVIIMVVMMRSTKKPYYSSSEQQLVQKGVPAGTMTSERPPCMPRSVLAVLLHGLAGPLPGTSHIFL